MSPSYTNTWYRFKHCFCLPFSLDLKYFSACLLCLERWRDRLLALVDCWKLGSTTDFLRCLEAGVHPLCIRPTDAGNAILHRSWGNKKRWDVHDKVKGCQGHITFPEDDCYIWLCEYAWTNYVVWRYWCTNAWMILWSMNVWTWRERCDLTWCDMIAHGTRWHAEMYRAMMWWKEFRQRKWFMFVSMNMYIYKYSIRAYMPVHTNKHALIPVAIHYAWVWKFK